MTIACLGWGSLIWDPRELPLAGDWANDGPELPLEFARQSRDGRMTLVIVHHNAPVQTFWAPMKVDGLNAAIDALANREGVETPRAIGRTPGHDVSHPLSRIIAEWAEQKGLAGVVWTNLKPGFLERRGETPTLEEIKRYVATLSPDVRNVAAEYVRSAPLQIKTPYRADILEALQS